MSYLRLVIREEVYVDEEQKVAAETVQVDNQYFTVQYYFKREQAPLVYIKRGSHEGNTLFTCYGYDLNQVSNGHSTDRMLLEKIKAVSWLVKQLHLRLDLDDIIDRYLVN